MSMLRRRRRRGGTDSDSHTPPPLRFAWGPHATTLLSVYPPGNITRETPCTSLNQQQQQPAGVLDTVLLSPSSGARPLLRMWPHNDFRRLRRVSSAAFNMLSANVIPIATEQGAAMAPTYARVLESFLTLAMSDYLYVKCGRVKKADPTSNILWRAVSRISEMVDAVVGGGGGGAPEAFVLLKGGLAMNLLLSKYPPVRKVVAQLSKESPEFAHDVKKYFTASDLDMSVVLSPRLQKRNPAQAATIVRIVESVLRDVTFLLNEDRIVRQVHRHVQKYFDAHAKEILEALVACTECGDVFANGAAMVPRFKVVPAERNAVRIDAHQDDTADAADGQKQLMLMIGHFAVANQNKQQATDKAVFFTSANTTLTFTEEDGKDEHVTTSFDLHRIKGSFRVSFTLDEGVTCHTVQANAEVMDVSIPTTRDTHLADVFKGRLFDQLIPIKVGGTQLMFPDIQTHIDDIEHVLQGSRVAKVEKRQKRLALLKKIKKKLLTNVTARGSLDG